MMDLFIAMSSTNLEFPFLKSNRRIPWNKMKLLYFYLQLFKQRYGKCVQIDHEPFHVYPFAHVSYVSFDTHACFIVHPTGTPICDIIVFGPYGVCVVMIGRNVTAWTSYKHTISLKYNNMREKSLPILQCYVCKLKELKTTIY